MKEVFPMVPATSGPVITFGVAALVLGSIILLAASAPVIVFGIVALVAGGIILLLGSFAYASRHVKFEVSPEGLAIRGDLYGRRLPAASLLREEARAVDLTEEPELPPGVADQRRRSAGLRQRLVPAWQRRQGPDLRDGQAAGGLPAHPGGLLAAPERAGTGEVSGGLRQMVP